MYPMELASNFDAQMSESEMVVACQNGDMNQFTCLYDLYSKKIYGYIYNKTLHRETAEDLTSKTFMKALEKINSYKSKKASFATWLYQIARNTVIDSYRINKKDISIDDVWDLSTNEDIPAQVDARMSYEKLQIHLQGFKSEHRDILMMKFWLGMSYREIGEAIGKSENNVKQINSRTVRKLRDSMIIISVVALFIQLKP